MNWKNSEKRILAAGFVLFMILTWIGSDSVIGFHGIGTYVYQQAAEWLGIKYTGENQESNDSIEQVKSAYTESLWNKQGLINLNGFMARKLNIRGQYSDIGMYVLDDAYVVTAYPETSTDYEVDQMTQLKEFLDKRGINLLYVNEPVKYLDDSLFEEKFGVECYSNRNADLFMERIREAGISAIDLREELTEDGMNIYDMFYRTDHHWTTESGFWAARKIAEGLNEYCGYNIDISMYDEDNYTFQKWEDCWLGEQGRKIAESYVGLDDFTLIKPKFQTELFIRENGEYKQGSFDDLIEEERYVTEGVKPSEALSWYYSYELRRTRNEQADYGKILVLLDSYGHVSMPYLSLAVRDLDYRMLRNKKYNLPEIIEKGKYDTVIVAYAQFMIGAYEAEGSANSRMFTFFE